MANIILNTEDYNADENYALKVFVHRGIKGLLNEPIEDPNDVTQEQIEKYFNKDMNSNVLGVLRDLAKEFDGKKFKSDEKTKYPKATSKEDFNINT